MGTEGERVNEDLARRKPSVSVGLSQIDASDAGKGGSRSYTPGL